MTCPSLYPLQPLGKVLAVAMAYNGIEPTFLPCTLTCDKPEGHTGAHANCCIEWPQEVMANA